MKKVKFIKAEQPGSFENKINAALDIIDAEDIKREVNQEPNIQYQIIGAFRDGSFLYTALITYEA